MPSTSVTVPVSARSVAGTRNAFGAVTTGAPPAGSFTAVTSMVMVFAATLSKMPSLTLKVKLARPSPYLSAGGVYSSLPAPISAAATISPAETAAPSSVRRTESVTILTPARTSPASVSAKPKSAVVNV